MCVSSLARQALLLFKWTSEPMTIGEGGMEGWGRIVPLYKLVTLPWNPSGIIIEGPVALKTPLLN